MSQIDFSEFVNDYDDWTCVICQDGDEVNDSRTRHGCGNHEFHTKCLEQERRRDTRCPICRFVEQGGTTSRILTQEPDQFVLPFRLRPQHYDFEETPGHIYQTIPDRSNRISPMIIADSAFGMECSYCREQISNFIHWRMTNCNHHIHIICLFENMAANGIDIETGELFCALCNYIRTH
jgi:Ring finger domain